MARGSQSMQRVLSIRHNKVELSGFGIERKSNLAMFDVAITEGDLLVSRFAAIQVEKKCLWHITSLNAKGSEKFSSNDNFTWYPDLIPTLAGKLRVSTSKLMNTS
jgi:hypothetical protein